MSELTYETRPEGRMVSSHGLSVILLDDDVREIRGMAPPPGCEDAWNAEVDRLCALAERIVSPESGLDVFPYLPLTKDGRFPKNRNALIAQSRIRQGSTVQGTGGPYPVSSRLQLRLVPAYAGLLEWLAGERMENTMVLKTDMFDSTGDQVPVFGDDMVPRKPDQARASYLKDRDVLPGRVYEEKSGARFLCLSGCAFTAACLRVDAAGNVLEIAWTREYCKPGTYAYVKWTDALSHSVGDAADFSGVMRALAKKDKRSGIGERQLERDTPRKFVKETGVLFDPATTRKETVMGPVFRNPWVEGELIRFRYDIQPYSGETDHRSAGERG